MRGTHDRTNDGYRYGEEPIKYRVAIELDPPATGRNKNEDTGGTDNKIPYIEFFCNNEHAYLWLNAYLGRNEGVSFSQCVLLDKNSKVLWWDANKNERSPN